MSSDDRPNTTPETIAIKEMPTYFAFSDECGDYKPNMTNKMLGRHPFYIRTTLLIDASEWKNLNSEFRSLKKKYGISNSSELKWAFLWSLRHHQQNEKPIPSNKPDLKVFESYDYKKLIDFVEESLFLLNNLLFKKIIISYTENKEGRNVSDKAMLGMHLQEHIQRIEMELQSNDDNLAVLFFDPVSEEKNNHFRELYYELFETGDFIETYSHIKDSLNIENSHHSVGIQIADYISGCFSAVLKAQGTMNYDRGVKMYFNSVHPNLRRNVGRIHGYGIREVPSSHNLRNWLSNHLLDLESRQ